VAPRPGERVLDVGCGRLGLLALWPALDVTGLDLPGSSYEGPAFVAGDARAMPLPDGAFDVAYCNSLLEHVPRDDRPLVAREIRRVARRWFVQTPNRRFPVEPHVLLPGFQFLPRAARRRLWPLGVAGGAFEDIELLDEAELRALFPESRIVHERVGPLTKSLVAVGGRT
jgi:SAM-dependent methyltransferase